MDWIPNFAVIGNYGLGKVRHAWMHLAGGGGSQPGGVYNQIFNFGSPQTQGGGIQSLWTYTGGKDTATF